MDFVWVSKFFAAPRGSIPLKAYLDVSGTLTKRSVKYQGLIRKTNKENQFWRNKFTPILYMTLYDPADQNPKITMRRDIDLILSNSSYLVENWLRCHNSYYKVIR